MASARAPRPFAASRLYAKLPRGFLIPTPVGDYKPDWAISFKEGAVKHIYFVAEPKGSMSSMALRPSLHPLKHTVPFRFPLVQSYLL